MEMKSYCMRVDQNLSTILERNANDQGIKISRYIRSLIEKGLVVDSRIRKGLHCDIDDDCKSYFDIKIAELIVQNLLVTRKVLFSQLESADALEEIEGAITRSRDYIKKLIEERVVS